MTSNPVPITTDPRFLLARKLITSGSPESAIEIFATLVEDCIGTLGENSFDAAICQYEYGNALFRTALRQEDDAKDANGRDDGDEKPAAKSDAERQREIMAAAAEKRARSTDLAEESTRNKRAKIKNEAANASPTKDDAEDQNDDGDAGDMDDVSLALEMMEASLNILLSNVEATDAKTNNGTTISNKQKEWALSQIPRILICIGDVHSHRKQNGNAVDAYIRALPYREDEWNKMKGSKENEKATVEHLQCQRRLAEAYVLVTEALLACPDGENVVSEDYTDSTVLVKAAERIDYTHSYYELAHNELNDLRKL